MKRQLSIAIFSLLICMMVATEVRGQFSGIQRGLSTNPTFPGGVSTTVGFDTTTVNVGGYPNSLANIAVANAPGLYAIGGYLTAQSTGGSGVVEAYVLVNGGIFSRQQYTLPAGGNFGTMAFGTLANLNIGDVVHFQVNPASGTNVQMVGTNSYSHASFGRHSPLATGIKRGLSSSPTFNGGVAANVAFDTTPVNVGGYTSGSGNLAFVQSAGLHTVNGYLTARATSGSGVVDVNVLVNGSAVSRSQYTLPTGGSFGTMGFGSLANLSPGDFVSIQINPSAGTNVLVAGINGYSEASLVYPTPLATGIQRTFTSNQTFSGGSSNVVFNATTVNVGGYTNTLAGIALAIAEGLHTIEGHLTARAISGTGVVDANLLVNGQVISRQQYTLTPGGTFSTLRFGSLADLDIGDLVSLQLNVQSGTIEVVGTNNYSTASLMHTPIPEPGSLAVLAFALAAGHGFRRRRAC